MKIEMGESLILSWLKHIKMCQIVQTNWKPSPEWTPYRRELVEQLEKYTSEYFLKLGYDLFKKNNSDQVQKQAEIDVLGLTFAGDEKKIYAVDIAFHKAGLGYGGTSENITRVLKKCIRTMMSLIQYFNVTTGHIVFASPKINPKDYQKLQEEFAKINEVVDHFGLHFTFELISNEKFNTDIIQPVLALSKNVSDTTELFLRSVQLLDICSDKENRRIVQKENLISNETNLISTEVPTLEQKVGAIAQSTLRNIIENQVTESEIEQMLTLEYSKTTFGLQYPLLVETKKSNYKKPIRYYKKPLKAHHKEYFMCSEWYETPSNNDKAYLIKWLSKYTPFDE